MTAAACTTPGVPPLVGDRVVRQDQKQFDAAVLDQEGPAVRDLARRILVGAAQSPHRPFGEGEAIAARVRLRAGVDDYVEGGRRWRRPFEPTDNFRVMARIIPTSLPPLRDRIRPGVRVLFVGINPGVRSALTGHHFAGFSNRFWKLLYESGLVPERIGCEDDGRLPEWGYGVTNIISRATPGIDALRPDEFAAGRGRLRRKIGRYRPEVVVAVGVTVFRAMFPERRGPVKPGLQTERIGDSAVFVVPNPSGRNANFSYGEMLSAYRALARHRRTLLSKGLYV